MGSQMLTRMLGLIAGRGRVHITLRIERFGWSKKPGIPREEQITSGLTVAYDERALREFLLLLKYSCVVGAVLGQVTVRCFCPFCWTALERCEELGTNAPCYYKRQRYYITTRIKRHPIF